MVTKFAILIPAHNEEHLLPRLLLSAVAQAYPSEHFHTIVIADNCTDDTARLARKHGVTVLERFDDVARGKGFALRWAIDNINLDDYAAILVIDADCTMGPQVLACLDGALQQHSIVQCYSGIANPDESWFTRLLDVSRTINNDVYQPAKAQLGLSSELHGTGMCFATSVLRKYGWDAFTIGEDAEYFAKLIQNGETVAFSHGAKIYHEESTTLRQATSQRMRWSSGRLAVAWRHGFKLLLCGLFERDLVKFDTGLSRVLPNPSLGLNLTFICLVAVLVCGTDHGNVLLIWFAFLTLVQLVVFLIGVSHTQNKLRKLTAIFLAPVFLSWKLAIDTLSILGVGRKKWVRTERKL